jgi:hypothetical protein
MKFSFEFNLTASKLLGYLIFIIGATLAFMLKDTSTFVSASGFATLLVGAKTVASEKTKRKLLTKAVNK